MQRVISCLGSGKVTTSPGGLHVVNRTHRWSINNDDPLVLKGGFEFHAEMRYRIVVDESEHGRFRVTTESYAYQLDQHGSLLFSLHWHPVGNSPVTGPHLHLPAAPRGHLVTERMTLEQAVRWCMEFGVVPARKDFEQVLYETESIHRLYRTWSEVPGRP